MRSAARYVGEQVTTRLALELQELEHALKSQIEKASDKPAPDAARAGRNARGAARGKAPPLTKQKSNYSASTR